MFDNKETNPLQGKSLLVLENFPLLQFIENVLTEEQRMSVRGYPIDDAPLFEIEDEIRTCPEDYLYVHFFALGSDKQMQRLSTSILNREAFQPHRTVVGKGVINKSENYQTHIQKLEASGIRVFTRSFSSANELARGIANALLSLKNDPKIEK